VTFVESGYFNGIGCSSEEVENQDPAIISLMGADAPLPPAGQLKADDIQFV
jgi:hypothetical protein